MSNRLFSQIDPMKPADYANCKHEAQLRLIRNAAGFGPRLRPVAPTKVPTAARAPSPAVRQYIGSRCRVIRLPSGLHLEQPLSPRRVKMRPLSLLILGAAGLIWWACHTL